jgi:expansin (peptidoglycan-binding protein)
MEARVIKGRPWVTAGAVAVVALISTLGINTAITRHRAAPTVTGAQVVAPDEGGSLSAADSTGGRGAIRDAGSAAGAPRSRPEPRSSPPAPKPASTTPKKKAAAAKPATSVRSVSPSGSGAPGAGRIRFGVTYTGVATFYAATGAGNCSFDASSDLMVAAMNQQDYENSQACGAFLAVTGPNGSTVKIKVVDRCPECPVGAIDLSREAFTKLAPASAGRIAISWRLLSPGTSKPVSYRYKSGSSRFWCGIQVLDHRNPIRSLEVKAGDSWKSLPREDFNYFIAEGGSGCGGPLRITDIYGGKLTDTGIEISPDAVQRGHAQFGAHS